MDVDSLLNRLMEPRTIGAIVVVVAVLWFLARLLSRPKVTSHVTTSRCSHCGWTGHVSKFKPVCPKCAKPISL